MFVLVATLGGFFICLAPLLTSAACYTTNTYKSWNYCQTVTLDHTKVASSSAAFQYAAFPVLVSSTQNVFKYTGFGGGHVGSSTGNDILFTKSDDSFQFAHEIEKYVSSTGEIEAWINVSSTLATSTDTIINMYYGSSSASNQQSVTSTWTAYAAVYHFASNSFNDSTANANNMNASGSIAVAVGEIDGATQFTAARAGASTTESTSLQMASSSVSYSLWFNTTSTATVIAVYAVDTGAQKGFHLNLTSSHKLQPVFQDGTVTVIGTSTASTVNDGAWHYVAIVLDQSSNHLVHTYLDGTDSGTTSTSALGSLTDATGCLAIGGQNGCTTFSGANTLNFDEVRASTVGTALSADWVKTEYNNQNAPSTFETFGSENTPPVVAGPVSPVNWLKGIVRFLGPVFFR